MNRITPYIAFFLCGNVQADALMDFVHQVMRTEIDYSRQFTSSDRFTRDKPKGRWSASHAPFIMPDPKFCSAPTPAPPARMRAAVDAFMPMMVEADKSRFTRRQRLEHLARSFFRDEGAEPALLEVNNYSFNRYSIVGVYGSYVDVRIVHPAPCATCDNSFLRLKTVVEDGKVRLMPSALSGEDRSWVNYWWSYSTGQHVPLCMPTV